MLYYSTLEKEIQKEKLELFHDYDANYCGDFCKNE